MPSSLEAVFEWRGDFTNDELNCLHAAAFVHDVLSDDWWGQVNKHSLGWVCARVEGELVGFVNVAWDGDAHAFLLDTIVAQDHQRKGIGAKLVATAVNRCHAAGCMWLHVDFTEESRGFYFEGCGFRPTDAGLIRLA